MKTTHSLRPSLEDAARRYGPAVLAVSGEPHAELLALVWGPRFDREHAQGLLRAAQQFSPQVLRTLEQVADQFDGWGDAQQRRVRQLILRHRRRWDNAACTTSC